MATKYIAAIVSFILLPTALTYGQDVKTDHVCTTCEGGGGGGGGVTVTCDATKSTLYVDASRPDNSGNGYTWGTAKKYLHAALYIANRCTNIDRINVAEGIYKSSTTATLDNRDNNFFVGESYSIYGGYPAGGGSRDYVNNPTILDGEIADGYEAYHVMVIYGVSGGITIDGFQVRNGFGDGVGSVDLNTDVPMVRNNGAGIYIRDASNVTIRNCAIHHNVVNGNGGGIFSSASNLTIVNTVIANNTAVNGGGLQNVAGSEAIITNNTFCGNIAYNAGGAAFSSSGTVLNITNTIVWGNTLVWGGGGTRNISYCLVQDGSTENNCLNVNPGFNNANNLDGADNKWFTSDDGLAIPFCSPAVNRGNNAATPSPANDITGGERKFNVQVDMGAYENQTVPYPLSADHRSVAGDENENYVYGGVTAISVPGCRIITHLTPGGASPVQGKVSAKTFIEGSNLTYNSLPLLTRHYEIIPVSNAAYATARVSLFFSNGEFNNYNQRNDAIAKLPTTDGMNKQELRIIQYHGTSASGLPGTYTGSVSIIDPDDADIIWSQASLTWRVSFNTVGFSGFFIAAVAKYRFSGAGNWSDASKWDNGKVPPAELPGFCEIIIANGSNCSLDVQQKILKGSKITVEPDAILNIHGNLDIVSPQPN